MREPEMFEPMVKYLEGQGYVVLEVNKGNKLGPDIVAEKGSTKLIIQMKGDSAATKTDWDTVLGQLLDVMDDEEANYAIAVSEIYERLVKAFPSYARSQLKLTFFIVRDNGTIESM